MSRFLSPGNSMFRSFAGDAPTILRLLVKFRVEFDANFRDWEAEIKQGDGERLFQIQHRWLSGFRTLGYEEISQKIGQIQKILHANLPNSSPTVFEEAEQLRGDLQAVRADLEAEIEQIEAFLKK